MGLTSSGVRDSMIGWTGWCVGSISGCHAPIAELTLPARSPQQLVKKLPNRQEHVVCEWKITRRCDGGNGRDGTLVINQVSSAPSSMMACAGSRLTTASDWQDFVKQTELIILTGLLIMREWCRGGEVLKNVRLILGVDYPAA